MPQKSQSPTLTESTHILHRNITNIFFFKTCRLTVTPSKFSIPWESDFKRTGRESAMSPPYSSYLMQRDLEMLEYRVDICFFVQKMNKLWWFIRGFRKNETSDCQLHVCLSVRPQGTTRLPPKVYSLSLTFYQFLKICRENSSFIKI